VTDMNAIEIENLTKIYRLYKSHKDRVKEIVSLNTKQYHHDFHALNDVSFSIKKGETVGIIGQNGSGKSTLLKIICGVTRPTSGSVKVNGRISSLLELGAGFHPDFTGRENVYMNGALMGFSKEEMERRLPEIEAFADIGEFIDQPVKSYSSGMYVRLAFAAAINVEPEILIVDEALSVGDVFFQTKCFAKFKEFKEKGVTILFVTHTLDLITTHCNCAVLLDKGILIKQAVPKVVIDGYRSLLASKGDALTGSGIKEKNRTIDVITMMSKELEWQGLFQVNPKQNHYGTREAEILEAGIFTPDNRPVQVLERNQECLIKIKVCHNEVMPAPIVYFLIKNSQGTVLCGTDTFVHNIEMGWMEKGAVTIVVFKQVLRLNPGEYLLSLSLQALKDGTFVTYDTILDYLAFQVVSNEPRFGIFDTESVIEWFKLD